MFDLSSSCNITGGNEDIYNRDIAVLLNYAGIYKHLYLTLWLLITNLP